MRYDEGPTAEADVLIDAPVARVWELVTDINLPAQFSNEFRGATWLDAGPALGARFVGRSWHKAMGEWETVSIVNRFDPTRVFGWCVTDIDEPSSTWSFELEQEPEGVRLRQRARMGPAPSGLSIAITAMPDKEERIVARRLEEFEANMRATLEGIKNLAEQPS
jgi:uncharacterized protein YndB with AHSA1/START domain